MQSRKKVWGTSLLLHNVYVLYNYTGAPGTFRTALLSHVPRTTLYFLYSFYHNYSYFPLAAYVRGPVLLLLLLYTSFLFKIYYIYKKKLKVRTTTTSTTYYKRHLIIGFLSFPLLLLLARQHIHLQQTW